MRRAPLIAAAALALAGCGDGDKPTRTAPKTVRDNTTRSERAEQKRIHERLRKSSLPKDMQRELEEAQRLLDAADR